jgi:hypothetical protein
MTRRAVLGLEVVYECMGWQMARYRSVEKATMVSTDV